MAIYKVQGPDGVEHELEGPDGATDEEIIEVAQSQFGQTGSAETEAPIVADPKTGLPPVDAQGMMIGTPKQQIEYERSGIPEGASEPEEMRALRHVNELGMGTGAAQLTLGAAQAVPGMIANTKKAGGIRNALAGWFEKKAAEQAAKAGGAGSAAEAELGAEGVRDYGRMLQDKGIVAPYRSSETSEQIVSGLKDVAGKGVGEARNAGDFRSIASGAKRPTTLDVRKDIESTLRPKYDKGLASWEKGQVDNALEELEKLSPVERSTTGSELVTKMDDIGYESARETDEFARLFPRRRADIKPGIKTGPQSYGPGAPIPKGTGEHVPIESGTYLDDVPTFTELFDKSTAMNTAAKSARQLQQPSGALTDSANILAAKSTEGLEGFLNADELAKYGANKKDWGDLSMAENLMGGLTAKGFANSESLPVSKFGALARALNAAAPHSAFMGLNKKIETVLRTDPAAFGKYQQILTDAVKRGGSALASTTFVLQQQDPEFQSMVKELNDNASE